MLFLAHGVIFLIHRTTSNPTLYHLFATLNYLFATLCH